MVNSFFLARSLVIFLEGSDVILYNNKDDHAKILFGMAGNGGKMTTVAHLIKESGSPAVRLRLFRFCLLTSSHIFPHPAMKAKK